MNSLNSLPLWSALAALGVAVPIVIHLWSRRQKIEIQWAAMELLKKAMVARSKQVHMEDRFLLLMRCLTLFLIAMALLRPLFNTSTPIGTDGAGIVIAIDASYSMGHGSPSRFEKALAKTREILSTVSEGDPVSIVLMSKQPVVLFRRIGYDPGSFKNGLEKSAKTSSHTLNLARNLELLLELSNELKTASKECYIISDAQVVDWQNISDQARSTLQQLSEKSRIVLTPVEAYKNDNLALTDFSYSAGSLQRDGSARFSAGIRNTGSQSVSGASVEFFVNSKLKFRKEVPELEAGENGIVSFYTSFDTIGDIALSARLSKDSLTIDNERHAIASISSSVRVLCIDGDTNDSSETGPRGAYFAIRALRLKHAEERAPIKVTHIDPAGLYGEKLNNYDVIMMFNVGDVNKDIAKRMRQYLDNGGGLFVFLGDKVEPEKYNNHFTVDGKTILPLKLKETIKHDDPTTGWKISQHQSDHALGKLVNRLPADLIAEASFQSVLTSVPNNDGEIILKLNNDIPLLISNRNGRIFVFTSSADRSWTNLPTHPLFMILLQQSATMLSNTAELSRSLVGDSINMPLPGRLMGDQVNLFNPNGESEPTKVTVVSGKTVAIIKPEQPGIYKVIGKAGLSSASIAANTDPSESELRCATPEALTEWLDGLAIDIVTSGIADAALNSRTGRDFSLTLLVLGALCFFIQGILANHLSRRIHSKSGGLVETLKSRSVAASRRS
jgi:hypothetical protein